ncbi:unnamed protein product, partial [Sphenostylis stenocarpa]
MEQDMENERWEKSIEVELLAIEENHVGKFWPASPTPSVLWETTIQTWRLLAQISNTAATVAS